MTKPQKIEGGKDEFGDIKIHTQPDLNYHVDMAVASERQRCVEECFQEIKWLHYAEVIDDKQLGKIKKRFQDLSQAKHNLEQLK